MWTALPPSDYYGAYAPPRRQQPTMSLPAAGLAGRKGGQHRGGSHVHCPPVDGVGTELYPYSLAVGTPQSFPTASRPARTERTGREGATNWSLLSTVPAQSARFRAVLRIKGPLPPVRFHCPFPSCLRGRRRLAVPSPPLRCRGLLPPRPAPPGPGCPQLLAVCCDRRPASLFTSPGETAPRGGQSPSKIGSSTSLMEACTTRSAAVGMPRRRSFPFAFGIIFSRTGAGTNRRALRIAAR